jgi:hypothetical protein
VHHGVDKIAFKSERCGLKPSGGTDVAEVGFRRPDLYRTGRRDDRPVADTAAGLIVDDRRYIAGPLTRENRLTPLKTTALEAVISELGRLAVQVGEQLNRFFPGDWEQGIPSRVAFAQLKQNWMDTFYPTATSEQ